MSDDIFHRWYLDYIRWGGYLPDAKLVTLIRILLFFATVTLIYYWASIQGPRGGPGRLAASILADGLVLGMPIRIPYDHTAQARPLLNYGMQMNSRPNNSGGDRRPQDFWENNSRVADDFSFRALDQCPLMRGEIGALLRGSIAQQVKKTAMNIALAMASLPPDQFAAFRMYSERATVPARNRQETQHRPPRGRAEDPGRLQSARGIVVPQWGASTLRQITELPRRTPHSHPFVRGKRSDA